MAAFTSRLLKSRRTWAVAVAVGLAAVALWLLPPYVRGYFICRELDRPYLVEFGRGSGWHGLETVKVLADGAVVLHRFTDRSEVNIEVARVHLPPPAMAQVAEVIEKHRLIDLQRAYHANLEDGTQWVLRFQQGDREKVVYFNNVFPAQIEQFAADLDRVLAENGSETADWRPVAYAPARAYERGLWASIQRR